MPKLVSNQDPNKSFEFVQSLSPTITIFIIHLQFEETELFVLWNFPHSEFSILTCFSIEEHVFTNW